MSAIFASPFDETFEYFDQLCPAAQDVEARAYAKRHQDILHEVFTDRVQWRQFFRAWQEWDAITLMRIVNYAMKDGLGPQIDDERQEELHSNYGEYDHECDYE